MRSLPLSGRGTAEVQALSYEASSAEVKLWKTGIGSNLSDDKDVLASTLEFCGADISVIGAHAVAVRIPEQKKAQKPRKDRVRRTGQQSASRLHNGTFEFNSPHDHW